MYCTYNLCILVYYYYHVAYFNVTVPCPEIFLSPLNNTIIVEEDTEFVCKAFSFGTIAYSWERLNDTLPAKSSTDICSSTLSIPNTTQFDEGRYCCVATNECGSVKQCAILSIIGKMECMHSQLWTHTCTHAHNTQTYTHIYTHIHIHAHTHTCTCILQLYVYA